MLNVTVPTSYEEITVKQVAELSKIKQPAFFDKYIKGEIEEADLSAKQAQRELPDFYRNILSVLTGENFDYFKNISPYEIRKVFEESVIGFYASVVSDQFEDCKEVDHFWIDGDKYILPTTKEKFGNILPMYGAQFGQWTDVMDTLNIVAKQLEGGMCEVLPQVLSILCQKEGDEYNEDVSLDRAKIFEGLKYSEVRYVFFLLFKQAMLSNLLTLTYINQSETEQERLHLKEQVKKTQQ